MESARWEVRQAQAEYADLIRERIAETATLFYDLLEAKALVDLAQQDVEILVNLEQIAKRGVEAGGIPAVEWMRINLDLLQCRQELIEAEKTQDILKAQLRAQFGRADYDPNFDIVGDLDVPASLNAMPLEEAFFMAQQNRPDIRALRMGVAKARADVHLENRNARPEVTAFGGVGREYGVWAGHEDKDYNSWGVGVTVAIPLFDRNQGNRMAARSALTQSNREYQLGIVDLRAEIVEVDRELRTAHQLARTFATEEVRLAREVRDIMIEGFRAGGRPLIDVLDAERGYREVVRLFVTSRADYWRAFYVYNSVVGVDSVNVLRAPAR
jgi:cobalt-zinc-cadmium efflux system outer membrane protein